MVLERLSSPESTPVSFQRKEGGKDFKSTSLSILRAAVRTAQQHNHTTAPSKNNWVFPVRKAGIWKNLCRRTNQGKRFRRLFNCQLIIPGKNWNLVEKILDVLSRIDQVRSARAWFPSGKLDYINQSQHREFNGDPLRGRKKDIRYKPETRKWASIWQHLLWLAVSFLTDKN